MVAGPVLGPPCWPSPPHGGITLPPFLHSWWRVSRTPQEGVSRWLSEGRRPRLWHEASATWSLRSALRRARGATTMLEGARILRSLWRLLGFRLLSLRSWSRRLPCSRAAENSSCARGSPSLRELRWAARLAPNTSFWEATATWARAARWTFSRCWSVKTGLRSVPHRASTLEAPRPGDRGCHEAGNT